MNPLRQSFVGESPAFLRTLELLQRVAGFDAPVLLKGETGTGKELAARAVHYHSPRAHGPFVPLNCGALPDTLIESELYGHERGAFTDARNARAGLVAAAEGGTLFLDEVDSLSPRGQVSLLRFLQDKTYRSVGGVQLHQGNVRIIAAASPRLGQMLEQGAFRDDLAFRLDVFGITLPPLRERGDDALLLVRHFVRRHARHFNVPERELSPQGVAWARQWHWPGNVRELDSRVQRMLLLSDDAQLQLPGEGGALAAEPRAAERRAAEPRQVSPGSPALPPYNAARDQALAEFERHYLQRLMGLNGGNVTHAARMAGKERRNLGRLLKKHGIAGSSASAL